MQRKHRPLRILAAFLFAAAILGMLSGCNGGQRDSGTVSPAFHVPSDTQPISRKELILNTIVTVTLYDSDDEQILQECMALCRQYEAQLSRTIPQSEISRINQNGEGQISASTVELLQTALDYGELSGGALDVTIGRVSALWNFTAGMPQLPDPQDMSDALDTVDYRQLQLDGQSVRMNRSAWIDLGAVAKGYIADKMGEFLRESGVTSAIINLGGNVLAVGGKPDGSPFKIGIKVPFLERNEGIAGIVETASCSVVTSGVYERYFTIDGENYHHILDPKTGYPAENELNSVTIISEKSVTGDALSTACFVLGQENGMALVESLSEVEAIFVLKDGSVQCSSGIGQGVIFNQIMQ